MKSFCKSLKSLPYAAFSLPAQSFKSTPYASISGVTNSILPKYTKSLPYAKDSDLLKVHPRCERWNPHLTRASFNVQTPLDNDVNPHLTRDIFAVNSKLIESLKSLPYANKFDSEFGLQIFEILTLRDLFVAFAVIKIHTLREHFWRYELKFAKIPQILTLRGWFSFVKHSPRWPLTKSAPYASVFWLHANICFHVKTYIFNKKMKTLCAEILTLLGTFLRLFEASNPYIFLKHFTQAFFDLERWNPHLTRNFSCINAKIYK